MAAASEHANQLKAMKATASAAALQRVEDEEPLQAKFAAIQRVEEEEPLQGKFSTAQRVEEDEPLQNKRMTAQRVEDEELLQGNSRLCNAWKKTNCCKENSILFKDKNKSPPNPIIPVCQINSNPVSNPFPA
jgi:hypothetical protein